MVTTFNPVAVKPPVLLLIFNRPDLSCRVFERIRAAQPEQLFIAADGPRPGHPTDTQRCTDTRNRIMEMIDWPCDVQTLFRNENLGCKAAVSSAITWFFEHVEEGIILEDDCLPDLSFFRFCGELLDRYRDEQAIMMISGNNPLPARHAVQDSYMFSHCMLIWGWATWRRAWQHFDLSMSQWPVLKQTHWTSTFLGRRLSTFWENSFDFHYTGQGTTWDVQWVFTCWEQSGSCILPRQNMVENIGEVGVHMKPYDPCINLPAKPLEFPLLHPSTHEISSRLDRILMNRIYRSATATVGFILLFLCRSALSKDRHFWKDLRQTMDALGMEIRNRTRS